MEINFYYMEQEKREKMLLEMMRLLEQELPDNLEDSQHYNFCVAVAEFLEGFLITKRVMSPGVFGLLLHDAIICACKQWYIPAAMLLGIADRVLDPYCQCLYKFGKYGKYKVFNATLGIIDSIRDELASKKPVSSWKLWYLRKVARYLAPYGDRSVPGMEHETYEMPEKGSFTVKPAFIFVFDLDEDGNLRFDEINDKKGWERFLSTS